MKEKYVVIVAFEPEIQALVSVCDCVLRQGSIPIVVDNSEKTEVEKELNENVVYLTMEGNKGIASALNRGVAYAMENGADCVTFLDQDSQISEELITTLQQGLSEDAPVVAPVPIDEATGEEYPSFLITKCGNTKEIYAQNCEEKQKADIVITSGTTVKMEVFNKVGTFDEDFFIDFVDIEWSVRCKKKGVGIYILPSAQMTHKIGNSNKKVLFFTVNMHSPYRTYYKVRNAFLLLRKKQPFLLALRQIMAALVLNFFGFFGEKRWREYFRYYFLGIGHGIIGRKGKL